MLKIVDSTEFRASRFICRVFAGWVFIGCSCHFEHRVFRWVFMGVHGKKVFTIKCAML